MSQKSVWLVTEEMLVLVPNRYSRELWFAILSTLRGKNVRKNHTKTPIWRHRTTSVVSVRLPSFRESAVGRPETIRHNLRQVPRPRWNRQYGRRESGRGEGFGCSRSQEADRRRNLHADRSGQREYASIRWNPE